MKGILILFNIAHYINKKVSNQQDQTELMQTLLENNPPHSS